MWLRRDGTTRGERGCQGGGRGGPGGGKGPWNSPGGFFWGEGLGDLGSPDGRQGGTEVLTRLRAADIN